MAEIIETLVTEVKVEANEASIKAAEKRMEGLEQASLEAAKAADELTRQQLRVKEQLNATANKTDDLKQRQRELNAAIEAAKGPTEQQKKELQQLEKELRDNEQAAKAATKQLRYLGQAQAELSADERTRSRNKRELGQNINRAKSDIPKSAGSLLETLGGDGGAVGSLVTGLGGAATAAGAVGIALAGAAVAAQTFYSVLSTVVEAGARMESLRARLKTVTGSVQEAREAFGTLRTFAAETPFELEDVTNAFVRLKSLGMQPSTESLRAFGNIAAAQGKPIMDFVEAVADAATGEFERLKEFGIKASSQGDQVAFTFAGVTTKVRKDSREIAAFLQNLGETKFAGAMADQMNTFDGVLSNLKDTWTSFLDQIAQLGVLDELKLIMQEISGTMNDDLAAVIADVLVAALQWLREIIVDLKSEGGSLGETLKDLGAVLKLVIDAAQLLSSLEGTIAVFKAMFATVGTLAEALDWLVESISKLASSVGDFMPQGELLSSLWDTMAGSAGALLSTLDLITGSVRDQTGAMIDLGSAIEKVKSLYGPKDLSKASDAELQELRKQGGDQATKVDEEIKRRIAEREQSEGVKTEGKTLAELSEESEKQRARDAYKAKKAGRIDEAVKYELDNMSDSQLDSFIADPNVGAKAREKAEKERERRADKKRKGKKGKKEKDETLAADVEKQMKKTARELAQRDTVRALERGQIHTDEMREFEEVQYENRYGKMRTRWELTGELPAGIATDLAQIRRLPNEEDLVGRTQAPVISITNNIQNYKFDVTFSERAMVVEGTFPGATPQGAGTAILGEFRQGLQVEVGNALRNFQGSERL